MSKFPPNDREMAAVIGDALKCLDEAEVALGRGELPRLRQRLRSAARVLARAGHGEQAMRCHLLAARLAARRNEPAAVQEAAADAMRLARRHALPQGPARLVLAVAAVSVDLRTEAAEHARAALAAGAGVGASHGVERRLLAGVLATSGYPAQALLLLPAPSREEAPPDGALRAAVLLLAGCPAAAVSAATAQLASPANHAVEKHSLCVARLARAWARLSLALPDAASRDFSRVQRDACASGDARGEVEGLAGLAAAAVVRAALGGGATRQRAQTRLASLRRHARRHRHAPLEALCERFMAVAAGPELEELLPRAAPESVARAAAPLVEFAGSLAEFVAGGAGEPDPPRVHAALAGVRAARDEVQRLARLAPGAPLPPPREYARLGLLRAMTGFPGW